MGLLVCTAKSTPVLSLHNTVPDQPTFAFLWNTPSCTRLFLVSCTPVLHRDVDGLWYAFLDYLGSPAGSDDLAMQELQRRLSAVKERLTAKGGGPYLQGTDISAQDMCLAPRLHHILTALPYLKVEQHTYRVRATESRVICVIGTTHVKCLARWHCDACLCWWHPRAPKQK